MSSSPVPPIVTTLRVKMDEVQPSKQNDQGHTQEYAAVEVEAAYPLDLLPRSPDSSVSLETQAFEYLNYTHQSAATAEGYSAEPDVHLPTGCSVIEPGSIYDPNGRTYQGYREGKYFFPNDPAEQDRLDFQHAGTHILLDNKLAWAPFKETPKNVLDIGTGTGIWAIEFAEENPESNVVGSDISMIQPEVDLPNCSFVKEDAEEPWVHNTRFDYIHLRYVATCFDNFKTVIQHAFDNLVPGGWIELQDGAPEIKSANGTPLEGMAIKRAPDLAISGAAKLGKDILAAKSFKKWLLEVGFVDVKEHTMPLPINDWPTDPRFKLAGQYSCRMLTDNARGVMYKMVQGSGLSDKEIDELATQFKAQIGNTSLQPYWPLNAELIAGVITRSSLIEMQDLCRFLLIASESNTNSYIQQLSRSTRSTVHLWRIGVVNVGRQLQASKTRRAPSRIFLLSTTSNTSNKYYRQRTRWLNIAMPLHLLGKKSWNVYNADNVARVRRDEADSQAREEAEEQRQQEIDAERRLAILRGEVPPPLPVLSPPQRAARGDDDGGVSSSTSRNHGRGVDGPARKRRKRAGEDDTDFEMRLAREAAAQSRDGHDRDKGSGGTAAVSKAGIGSSSNAPLIDASGHIDLFAAAGNAPVQKNPEAEADKARRRREIEDQYTMRFANAAGPGTQLTSSSSLSSSGPWYTSASASAPAPATAPSRDLGAADGGTTTKTIATTGKDVWGKEDPRRGDRDAARLEANDPLAMMKRGAAKAREVKKERMDLNAERERELRRLRKEDRRRRRDREREREGSNRRGDGDHHRGGEDDIGELEGFSLDAPPLREQDKHSSREHGEREGRTSRRQHGSRHRDHDYDRKRRHSSHQRGEQHSRSLDEKHSRFDDNGDDSQYRAKRHRGSKERGAEHDSRRRREVSRTDHY
ncbi:hypothetical protein BX600DRAFT_493226 [Xylariales sp. PMI_506]|nr:hypothetical protein BX600DRAFT_493226 [Xylariales sp. PMI_506]